jgi:flagellar basal-body rod protein FlgG
MLQLSQGAKLVPAVVVPNNAVALTVSKTGDVRAHLANSPEEVSLGQIQLVNFQNENGLVALGEGLYRMSQASGSPILAVPGENGLGNIQQGALEGSNVNVANSMVDMIAAQRAYEMGTKVMGVADQMLGATVNIK